MARNSENRNATSRNSYGSEGCADKQTNASYGKNKTSDKNSQKASNRNSAADHTEDTYDKEY